MFRMSRAILLSGLMLLRFGGTADACSCYPPPPPCEAFWASDAVFIGTVTKISRRSELWVGAEFDVQESFRGRVGTHVAVGTFAGGGSCGAELAVGNEYLVYANGSAPDQLSTHLCSRTRLLDGAKDDLEYLRNRGQAKTATLEGRVHVRDSAGIRPQQDAEVRLTPAPPKMPVVRTDSGGRFRFEVAPGFYEFEVSRPGMRMLDPAPAGRKVQLPEGGACATRSATLVIDGRIRGRITDGNGAPIRGVPVEATGAETPDFLTWDDLTDERGEYEITGLGPGSYLVGVSIRRGLTPRVPHPVTYFPGVASAKKSVVLQLSRSEAKQGIDFSLGKLEVYEVRGVVSWPDGTPASRALVRGPHLEQAMTDSAGRFQMNAFAGVADFEAFTIRDNARYGGTINVDVRGPQGLGIGLRRK